MSTGVTDHPFLDLMSRYLVIKYKFNFSFDGLGLYSYIFYVIIYDAMNMYAGSST